MLGFLYCKDACMLIFCIFAWMLGSGALARDLTRLGQRLGDFLLVFFDFPRLVLLFA